MTEVRKFDTGATRSGDTGRYDPEGFLSPIVIERYSEYLHKHRTQPDGSLRDSDNWQKGIPLAAYAKGLWRHFLHFWTRHRGFVVQDPNASADIEEDLCAIIFGAQGYLFELLKERRRACDEIEAKTFGPLPDADGWIPWGGGPCPVAPHVFVAARFRTEVDVRGIPALAGGLHWGRTGSTGDIVAYRVLDK